MKSLKFASLMGAIAVAGMAFSSLSFAHNQDKRHGSHSRPNMPQYYPQQGQQHAPQVLPYDGGRPIVIDNRHGNYSGHRNLRRHKRGGYYYNARGPEFRRGGYIPREFRNRQYVVHDYRAYQLAPPQRNQQWVQVGGDYVLIGMATGLIASVILGR